MGVPDMAWWQRSFILSLFIYIVRINSLVDCCRWRSAWDTVGSDRHVAPVIHLILKLRPIDWALRIFSFHLLLLRCAMAISAAVQTLTAAFSLSV